MGVYQTTQTIIMCMLHIDINLWGCSTVADLDFYCVELVFYGVYFIHFIF